MKQIQFQSKNWIFPLCGIFLIIAYYIPYFFMGEDSYVLIHDNLDSAISRVTILFNQNALFDYDKIFPSMDGLSRNAYPDPYSLKMIFYWLLPPFWAYTFNSLFVKLIAFMGMYFLLHYHIISKDNTILASLLSLAFALIPFYSDYNLSAAGIPLISFAFLNLFKGEKIKTSYAIIALYCFYSSFVLSGVFLLCNVVLLIIYAWYKGNKNLKHLILGAAIFLIICIALNLGLIKTMLLPSDFVSHRVEFNKNETFLDKVKSIMANILYCQYHAGSFAAWVSLLVLALAVVLERSKKWIACIVILAILYLEISIGKLLPLFFSDFQLFRTFQFDRFYFLYPALCIAVLAFLLDNIKYKVPIAAIAISVLLFYNFRFDKEYKNNAKLLIGKNITEPTYRQFFDTSLFNYISDDLNFTKRDSVKTVVVGMYPSITEYNGFYTLDAYVSSYRLEYKHKFRNVIAKELDKSETLKDYYDNWGSRCYLLSSELNKNYLCGKQLGLEIKELSLNTDALRNLGCDYIFSAVPILNYKDIQLNFIKSYTTEKSFWKIYVYKL